MKKVILAIAVVVFGIFFVSGSFVRADSLLLAQSNTSSAAVGSQQMPWWPIVPCGLQTQPSGIPTSVHDYTQPCNQCLLVELFMNLINLVQFWIVPALGTLFFIIGGFFILVGGSAGNTGWVSRGKVIMKNTAIGIAIILASWLITTTILTNLTGQNQSNTAKPWFQIECSTGTLQSAVEATVPHPPQQNFTGGQTAGNQCLQSGLNLCQGNAPQGCANTRCGQYAAAAANEASGAATANVLKAFMEVESSCDITQVSGTSYGLMQLTPPIPQIYASRCGATAGDINQAWLTNPANAEKSICIAAQWINSVAQSQCGSSVRNLYAGYNGGQNGACAPSVSCASETSCSGEPVKKWECLYDDTAHTQCNGATASAPQGDINYGYNQTRQGATRALACAANPGF